MTPREIHAAVAKMSVAAARAGRMDLREAYNTALLAAARMILPPGACEHIETYNKQAPEGDCVGWPTWYAAKLDVPTSLILSIAEQTLGKASETIVKQQMDEATSK